jgi:hypothetical protein
LLARELTHVFGWTSGGGQIHLRALLGAIRL